MELVYLGPAALIAPQCHTGPGAYSDFDRVQCRIRPALLLKWKKFKLIYDLVGSHLEPITRFLFSVWRLRVSWCVAPSLTRGWVCNLLVQSLLGLARAVTPGSKSLRTHDHILLSHLRLPQPGGPGPRIYIPQEQGGPVIPPGTGFPFVASYDSQGCGGGILTRLHTGIVVTVQLLTL
jgi:hypothetical protein